jgi:hypothetical protein
MLQRYLLQDSYYSDRTAGGRLLGICNNKDNIIFIIMGEHIANPDMDNTNMTLDEAIGDLKDLLDDMDCFLGYIIGMDDKMDAVRYAINKLEVIKACGGKR